ncbi:hypothetical protein B9Z55_017632 [Caenorhabditis nigoni]|uniref:Cytochrome P450 n=1 Tax=Caenorhabditis nigoni TaxID=1611254 RepID=A0A2G5TAK6_9PELO|nr:hypothetical protein B9Z55_017632 [Caenorhabditis nigoni]
MFFISIISFILTWLVVRQYQKVSRLPPGPVSLPLIGNVPQIVYYLWSTGGIVSTLDLFRKLGPIPHVNIADYETAHEVFVKNANKYADKFHAPLFQAIRNDKGVAGTNGDHWQEMKRFALQIFRNMGVGKDIMELKIIEELDARCADIDKAAVNGVTITQASDFFDLTVGSIINNILVGRRFDEDNKEEFFKVKHSADSAIEVVSLFDMMLPVWVLKTFFKAHYDTVINSNEETRDFVGKEAEIRDNQIKSGKYSIDENNVKDYTDAFLLKIQKDGENKNFK